jgi:hypothetical protein
MIASDSDRSSDASIRLSVSDRGRKSLVKGDFDGEIDFLTCEDSIRSSRRRVIVDLNPCASVVLLNLNPFNIHRVEKSINKKVRVIRSDRSEENEKSDQDREDS